MPSERHIRRQIEWSDKLKEFGCEVTLEESIEIEGARVVPDVLAKAEGKAFLIEIGDIGDERKNALMRLYAEQNPNIEFIHEPYGSDKINEVLESLNTYRQSAEYKAFKRLEHVKRLNKMKEEKQDRDIKLSALFIFIIGLFSACITSTVNDVLYLMSFLFILIGLGTLIIKSLPKLSMEVNKPNMKIEDLELNYECPQCGQPCTKEEYESGYCLDCDQIEMN